MDYSSLIEKRRNRLEEIEVEISQPNFFNDQKAASKTMREHRQLKNLLESWDQLKTAEQNLAENRELTKENDPEIAEMAQEEIPALEKAVETLSQEVTYALLPSDETESRDALVEIRGGAGGDEANIFAGDLLRMYQRYCEERSWKTEIIDSHPSESGGVKSVTIKVSGNEVFRFLKYESGVHRVQRVPATETQGRIHTSTASVAVLPEAEEVDVQLKKEDLDIQTCRAGGAGGQHVNTTDSAVQITHKPTGIMVRCEHGRSQHQNRELGMQILVAKIFEEQQRKQQEEYSANRKALIGSGDRSEKIRTYNYPQSRVTDHRVNHTSHNLDGIMEGALFEFADQLQAAEMEARLKEEGLN